MDYLRKNEDYLAIPCKETIISILNHLRNCFFPGYFDCCENKENALEEIRLPLENEIHKASELAGIHLDEKEIVNQFFQKVPSLIQVLKEDLESFYEGDPAARDIHEIILSYPGFFTVFVYRIAHEFYVTGVPYLPRIMSEYAHSLTGIDIHPGATIGDHFFIDHGTGIVIGETAVIGSHVRIYQGVTIGALSLGRGHQLQGQKRHPTIGSYVTIYSGASILGGDTIIGDHVIIGSNTYILDSVKSNTIIRLSKVDMEIIDKK